MNQNEQDQPEIELTLDVADMHIHLHAYTMDAVGLSITDTVTKAAEVIKCNAAQSAAIIYLAINGDDGPEEIISAMYAIAEPLVAHLPQNLRPIP